MSPIATSSTFGSPLNMLTAACVPRPPQPMRPALSFSWPAPRTSPGRTIVNAAALPASRSRRLILLVINKNLAERSLSQLFGRDNLALMPTCFVVMGFGKKTDYPTGRVLDLDKSYRYIIKPAAEAAGYECVRADEIQHSGNINVPMYQQLLDADVVIADV